MKTVWTQHLEGEEKTKFETGVVGSKWLLDRMKDILDSMERGLDAQELSPRAYDQPNWDYRQAHSNGYRQCLKAVKELLTLDHKENK